MTGTLRMSLNVLETLVAIAVAIIISTISSWITVQLSLRRFRLERWWERKAQAYENVINALHESKIFADRHLEARIRGVEVPEEEDVEIRKTASAAREKIQRLIDVGALLISENAIQRLRRHTTDEQNASNTNDWIRYLENLYGADRQCITDMIEIAKADLKTKNSDAALNELLKKLFDRSNNITKKLIKKAETK